VAAALKSGRTDWAALEREAAEALASRGWRPDYVAIRVQDDLREPAIAERLIVLGASILGSTRLIDNLEV
jgi:pantoate--beta-alanine ligase